MDIALIDNLIDITLLAFLTATAIAIIRMRNLFVIIMMFGIFSLHSAGLFVVMDASDVAFTEAAVGAGIQPILGCQVDLDYDPAAPGEKPRPPAALVLLVLRPWSGTGSLPVGAGSSIPSASVSRPSS